MLIVREIKDTVVTNLRNAPHVKDVEKNVSPHTF